MNLHWANAGWIYGISLAALVIPLALWWKAVRARNRADLVVPGRVALARLNEARRFMQPEDAIEFATAVAEIVRSYTAVRFKLTVSHQSTDEFLRNLLTRPNDLLTAQRESLADFLRRCDLAKFEHWLLSPEEMEALLASACNFVVQSSRLR